MYVFLTQLLDTSNYRVVSAEIGTDIVVSTKIYAYRIYTVRFVVAIRINYGSSIALIIHSLDPSLSSRLIDRNPFITRLL